MLPISYRIKRKLVLTFYDLIRSFVSSHQELADFTLLFFSNTVGPPSSISDIHSSLALLAPVDNGHPLVLVGDGFDGSYLLPDDEFISLQGIISPGVGAHSAFEQSFISEYSTPVVGIDPTITEIPKTFTQPSCTYVNKFLASSDSVSSVSVESLLNSYFPSACQASLLLQLDIEGGEYLSLLSTPPHILERFRIIAIEFHDLNNIASSNFLHSIFFPLITKLSAIFDLVHFHPNNACPTWTLPSGSFFPTTIETTWHHKSRRLTSKPLTRATHIHPMDILNSPSMPMQVVDFNLFL